MQLVTTNFAGNLHVSAGTINEMGLADYVLAMESTGYNTIVVFRVPDNDAPHLRKRLGYTPDYWDNPQPKVQP